MYKFFRHCKMHGGENISEERLSAIKSSVLSQVNQSEEDIPMKKTSFIKPLVIAATITALTAATAISSVAATQPKIVEIDGKMWEVYQQDEFRGMAKCLEEEPTEEAPDDSEFTLVSTNEYTEGDYRYVTKVFKAESHVRSSFIWWHGQKEVYYEPDNSNSIHLSTMDIWADFFRSEEQDVIFVDEDTIICETEKLVDQTYPIITDKDITYKSNQGGYWGGNKYAYVKYSTDIEMSNDYHNTHSVELVVNVLGEAHVN